MRASTPDTSGVTDVVLTRHDGRKDTIVCVFPSVPDRMRVHIAYRRAVGYRRDDDAEPDPDAYDGQDVLAVHFAALGLCRSDAPEGWPTFRGCGRDVVAYGEAVQSALWFEGYTDPSEQSEAGGTLLLAMMEHMFRAIKAADADFPKAPDSEAPAPKRSSKFGGR